MNYVNQRTVQTVAYSFKSMESEYKGIFKLLSSLLMCCPKALINEYTNCDGRYCKLHQIWRKKPCQTKIRRMHRLSKGNIIHMDVVNMQSFKLSHVTETLEYEKMITF